MVHTHKHWISIFMGLFIGVLSIPPLLAQFGLISLSLPAFLETFTLRFIYFILLIGALYLLIDSTHESGTLQAVTILIGLVVGIIALIHILIYFNIITFVLPTLPTIILRGVLAIIALLLFIGGFVYH